MHGVAGNLQRGLFTPVVWFVDIFGSSRRKETKKKRSSTAPTQLQSYSLSGMRNAECALVVYSYASKWEYT